MSRFFSNCGLPVEYIYDSETEKTTVMISNKVLTMVNELPFKEYFYCDGYSMKVFQDESGEIYEEFEQACPWYGGPNLYLGLRKVSSKEIVLKWDKIPELE